MKIYGSEKTDSANVAPASENECVNIGVLIGIMPGKKKAKQAAPTPVAIEASIGTDEETFETVVEAEMPGARWQLRFSDYGAANVMIANIENVLDQLFSEVIVEEARVDST